nr:hypothetical protein CFP56_30000 [Quercus suber]
MTESVVFLRQRLTAPHMIFACTPSRIPACSFEMAAVGSEISTARPQHDASMVYRSQSDPVIVDCRGPGLRIRGSRWLPRLHRRSMRRLRHVCTCIAAEHERHRCDRMDAFAASLDKVFIQHVYGDFVQHRHYSAQTQGVVGKSGGFSAVLLDHHAPGHDDSTPNNVYMCKRFSCMYTHRSDASTFAQFACIQCSIHRAYLTLSDTDAIFQVIRCASEAKYLVVVVVVLREDTRHVPLPLQKTAPRLQQPGDAVASITSYAIFGVSNCELARGDAGACIAAVSEQAPMYRLVDT